MSICFVGMILAAGVLAFDAEPVSAVPATVNISNNEGQSTDPVIATSGINVFVAWTDDTSGNSDIIFAKSQDGGDNFGNPTTLDDDGGTSLSPSIAASGNNVYLAWRVDNDIYFAKSDNSGDSFTEPTNLSSNPSNSNNPRVAASGSNVYVAWVDGSTTTADIYLVASNNSGTSFSSQLILDDGGGRSSDPRVASSDSNAYIVWKNLISGNNEIYFSTSADGGANFSVPDNLSSTAGSSTTPAVASAGSNVYVSWSESTAFESAIWTAISDDIGSTFESPVILSVSDLPAGLPSIATSGNGDLYVTWEVLVDAENDIKDVYFSSIGDGGATSTEPVNLSSNSGQSVGPSVAASSDGIYVVWLDYFIDPINAEVFATFSSSGVLDFVAPINLSNSPGNTLKPGLAIVEGQDAVVVMYEIPDESTPAEIHFQSNVDFTQAVISIDEVVNPNPRWDIDLVTVSGTMSNAEEGDTVSIDWGDGNVTSGLDHTGSDWGPFSHPYSSDSIASNPVQIVVHLVDSTEEVRASSEAESILVQPHSTALEIDFIASVAPGANVTISGNLVDVDESIPISGALVTLNGTGVSELSVSEGLVTADGIFAITGPAPNSTADNWTVQAHFGGNQTHSPSDSAIEVYATQSVDAVEYPVSSGQNVSLALNNLSFNATILFADVMADGSIFVSECETPASDRYVSMEICTDISSSLLLADDTDFVLTIKFADAVAGVGGVTDDIDMFHHTGSGQLVDITQSRDQSSLTVSGVASSFSKFVVAKAVHPEEPDGAYRQQLYVSSDADNVIQFRDITNTNGSEAEISLDKDRHRIGETAILTIIDPEGNVDPSEIDIVSAGIESETSKEKDPSGVLITLLETEPDSHVFQGSFTLASGSSSGSSLEAKSGDELTVAYNIPGRARLVIDGVAESGHIQVTDFLVPQDADFRPFGGAIKAELVDAQLAPGARINVTLSYANANLSGNNPEFLRMVQEVSDGVWIDITLRDLQGNITGVDTEAKTITGETGSLGSFSVGGDVGIPGGAGGGLSRPGSGLVVDFVASVVSSTRSGGGGGGSGSTEGIMSLRVSGGSDTNPEFALGANSTLTIEFESITSPGSIYLEEMKISELPSGSFVATSLTQGTVDLQGSEAQTVGKIFDITYSSGFGFEPPILVTLPYDESLVNASGLSEQDVRLLHYADGKWEDTTVSVNTTANTVSGKLDSLSPVAAAVSSDGTFGAAYYDENPLTKVSDVLAITEDPSRIVVDLRNTQRVEQRLTILAQVLDADGVAMAIGWTSGTIFGAQSGTYEVDLGISELSALGGYTIQVFVIDDIESLSPEMLAPQVRIGPDFSQ